MSHEENENLKLDTWEIWKLMRKHLRYTWRKPQIRPANTKREDVVYNRTVFKAFIWGALRRPCRLIFVDESYFNPRKIKHQSWVSKDEQTVVTQIGYGAGATSICALTDQGLLISQLWKGKNSAREILLFFIDLENFLKFKEGRNYDSYRKQLIIIFDNASIHTTFELAHFFRVRGLQAVTLPQYTPEWNPIEKAFSLIKTKISRANLQTE